jgi:hypothetical protein
MAMETLGGNLPPGRAAAVFAAGRTHIFAIAAGGTMSHWTSADGVGWQGPVDLLQGPGGVHQTGPDDDAV